MPEFLSDINNFLAYQKNSATPSFQNCPELIAYIQVRTGLSQAQCRIVLSTFFQEIRNIILNDQKVSFDELGTFFRYKNNRIAFKASLRLKKRLNGAEKQKQ